VIGDTVGSIATLLASAGLGGVVGAFFRSRFEHQSLINKAEHELKQKRYSCILLLMLAYLNPDSWMHQVSKVRPDIVSSDDVLGELRAEVLNGMVYANQDVLLQISIFLSNPSPERYVDAVLSVRKDLWGGVQKRDRKVFKQVSHMLLHSEILSDSAGHL